MQEQCKPFGQFLLLLFTKSIVPTQLSFIFTSSDIEEPACKSSVSLLVSFFYFYSQKASFLLNCRPSLPVQISKNPAYKSSGRLLVSFCYIYSQKASFLLNCRPSLPVQTSQKPAYKNTVKFLVSFCHFYSQKASFLLNCR